MATCVVAIMLALFGYHWLHMAQRVITVALVVVTVAYVVGLAVGNVIPTGRFRSEPRIQPGAVHGGGLRHHRLPTNRNAHFSRQP